MLQQRQLVSFKAEGTRRQFRPSDMRNMFAPHRDKMFRCHQTNCSIIDANEVGAEVCETSINEDKRDLLFLQLSKLHRVVTTGGNNQAIQSMRYDLLNLPFFKRRVIFGRSDDDVVSALLQNQRQSIRNFEEKGVKKSRNDETN